MSDNSEIFSALHRVKCCLQTQINDIIVGEEELIVGESIIEGGTNGKVLYDNNGILGETFTLYSGDGVLANNRTVDQSNNTLTFTNTNVFSVEDGNGNPFLIIDPNNNIDFEAAIGDYYNSCSGSHWLASLDPASSYITGKADGNGNFIGVSGNNAGNTMSVVLLGSYWLNINASTGVSVYGKSNAKITLDETGTSITSECSIFQNTGATSFVFDEASSQWKLGDITNIANRTNLVIDDGLTTIILKASAGVGINGAPNVVAVLDIQSTTQGVKFPSQTTVQRTTIDTTNIPGLVVYDTDLDGLFCTNNSGNWFEL